MLAHETGVELGRTQDGRGVISGCSFCTLARKDSLGKFSPSSCAVGQQQLTMRASIDFEPLGTSSVCKRSKDGMARRGFSAEEAIA